MLLNVDSTVSIATRVDSLGLKSLKREEIFSAKTVQTGFRSHQATYSVGTGILFRGWSGRGMKLTTRIHLVSRLRMLPLYVSIAWMGTTLPTDFNLGWSKRCICYQGKITYWIVNKKKGHFWDVRIAFSVPSSGWVTKFHVEGVDYYEWCIVYCSGLMFQKPQQQM